MEEANLTFAQPKFYNFVPQPDITPLEAAWIAYLFRVAPQLSSFDLKNYKEWSLVERHFEEVT